jgi:outer membrane lipopolysaccharide assembly protein LptE/RlpB
VSSSSRTSAATTTSALVLFLATMMMSGCLGYRMGTTLPPGVRSVYVPTFINNCGEPDVESTATSATIQELRRDGSLKLLSADQADAILDVTLTRYELKPLRYSSDSSTEASEYRLMLTASIVLRERETGKILAENASIRGKSTFEPEGDIASAKQSALPAAARDLAHDIVESVVEAW